MVAPCMLLQYLFGTYSVYTHVCIQENTSVAVHLLKEHVFCNLVQQGRNQGEFAGGKEAGKKEGTHAYRRDKPNSIEAKADRRQIIQATIPSGVWTRNSSCHRHSNNQHACQL